MRKCKSALCFKSGMVPNTEKERGRRWTRTAQYSTNRFGGIDWCQTTRTTRAVRTGCAINLQVPALLLAPISDGFRPVARVPQANPPYVRALLDIRPVAARPMIGLELEAQRPRIVVGDQLKAAFGRQMVE